MEIPNLDQYTERYRSLENQLETLEDDPANLLIAFPMAAMAEENWPADMKVTCEYHELTAYCPWTHFPDQGSVFLEYIPDGELLELKSYKYYLLAFRERHITQEHLAQKIFNDIQDAVHPSWIKVTLDYMPRGGIHTTFSLSSETIEREE